jgi:hypothetical protein
VRLPALLALHLEWWLVINREHTLSHGERPVFGGREVGIGFSGTYDGEGAECEATALAGKRSIRFRAVLRKLVAA